MTFPFLKSVGTSLTQLGGWISRKGWRESFARGDDVGSLGGSSGGCPNPAKQSTWVFACLQLIAGQVTSLPMRFYTRTTTGREVDYNDKETAEFWTMPAETASGRMDLSDFMELSLHWINLKGQACWILDDTWLTPRGSKSPILLARPDRLSPIKKGDMLLGWMFTDGIGSRYTLLPQQVIRPRFLNPYDDAEGLSPLDAARVAVDGDYAAGVFARNVAAANGDQGVYVVSKGGGALSDDQQAQIIAALRQKAMLSRKGDYRPAFLTADVAIEDPKIKTVDAAFNAGRMENRHEIYVAFGVPPSMADRMDSYSIGAASDRLRLVEQTCIPHSVRICKAIAHIERLRSGRVLLCDQDWSKHPTMAQVRTERAKAASDMWKTGVPWDVLSQVHDLGLPKFPGSDAAWLPMSMERVTDEKQSNPKEDDEKETTQTDGEGEEGDSKKALAASGAAIQELRVLIGQAAAVKTVKTGQCSNGHGPHCRCTRTAKAEDGDMENERDPERVKLWEKHMKARRPSEKLMLAKITKAVMAARRETLERLEASEKSIGQVRQRGVLDILFDLGDFTLAMTSGTRAAHTEVLDQALFQFAEEIGSDDPWKMESTTVFNFLNGRENKIRDASRGIHEAIKAELEAGLAEGESTAQLARRVRTAFNGITKERAEMIAATEITAAYGLARHDAMSGLDIEDKEWLSAQDGRVRDTHMRADGQVVAMDEPFIVELADGGTEELMFPGDPSGSAGNVIRCRCVEIPRRRED